jgi:FlaG/FlaF family flagellin (archaellin)
MEKRDNSGSLFKNDRKTTDMHPDYSGSVLIGGVDMWISAWIKKGNGKTFMSLSFKPKNDSSPTKTTKITKQVEDTDDIPW